LTVTLTWRQPEIKPALNAALGTGAAPVPDTG
jgi:hypothetical protein